MKIKERTRNLRWLLLLVSMLLVLSCSEDTEQDNIKGRQTTVELRSLAPSFFEIEPVTRAVSWPSGYYDYSDTHVNGQFSNQLSNVHRTIRVFFTDASESKDGNFRYDTNSNKWQSSVVMEAKTYQVYGFIPAEIADGAAVSNFISQNVATLTISGLNTVTPSDVCVVVGAKAGTSEATCEGLTTGQFDVGTNAGENASNYIFLLFDHLYSSLRFRFKVDATYASLRTIKLKKLEMKGFNGSTAVPSKVNATIILMKTNDGTSPLSEIQIAADANSSAVASEIFSSSDGLQLPSDSFSDFLGCFAPGMCSVFELTSTYDVYDTSGNLVRENCTATNKLDISTIFNNSVTRDRGKILTVNLTVNPTYLYVLSEPDLDNPTVTIN